MSEKSLSNLNPDKQKPRLLFVCLEEASFVVDDLEILSKRYNVRPFSFRSYRYPTRVGRFLGLAACGLWQFVWLIRNLPRADVVYVWFADYHALMPLLCARLLRVPVVVMLGGFDCNAIPELGYGLWLSRWRAPIARFVVRRANLLLASLPSHFKNESPYARWPDHHVDGLVEHVPEIQTPRVIVPLGFDPEEWLLGPLHRRPIVTTVARIDSERTLLVKGIDAFVETARIMPDVTFQVVGVEEEFQAALQKRLRIPQNMWILPPRPRSELQKIYAETSVYVQLSRVEAFGCVIAEAMLCGCIPIVSRVGGMPALVGAPEFVVDTPEPTAIAESIRKMFEKGPEVRKKMRERISASFSLNQREQRLLSVLDTIRKRRVSTA